MKERKNLPKETAENKTKKEKEHIHSWGGTKGEKNVKLGCFSERPRALFRVDTKHYTCGKKKGFAGLAPAGLSESARLIFGRGGGGNGDSPLLSKGSGKTATAEGENASGDSPGF